MLFDFQPLMTFKNSCHNYLKCWFFYHIRNFVWKCHLKFYRYTVKQNQKDNIIKIKTGSSWFIYKKWQVLSTIYQLFECNFWWSCLDFSDKIDLTIQLRICNNVKYRLAAYLKFRDRFFISLTMSGLEAKISSCSTIKENLFLYCFKFSAFVVTVIN